MGILLSRFRVVSCVLMYLRAKSFHFNFTLLGVGKKQNKLKQQQQQLKKTQQKEKNKKQSNPIDLFQNQLLHFTRVNYERRCRPTLPILAVKDIPIEDIFST